MLEIQNLSKQFKGNDFYSLKDVSLTINQGDIVGLVGKNGAGKSTLLKLMTKAIKLTQGKVFYKGQDIMEKSNSLDEFGIMIDPVFYPDLSVEDNLKFYLDLHGKQEYYSNIEETLKIVELWKVRHRKPKGFSFGMKQRTALAIAMVAEPDFLILDEPFVGLDPIGVQKLIDILKQWSSERQISMIISSHQLSELESLCNRYIHIDGGRLMDNFDKQKAPSIIFNLQPSFNVANLSSYLSEDVQLNQQNLEVSIDTPSQQLNALLAHLGQEQAVQTIQLQENHLKNLFKIGD